MKEFVISEVKAETAVLVGLITKQQDEAKTKEYLDELEFLADTAGAVTVKRFTQKVNGPSQTTYVGKGKLEEIKQYIKQCEDAADDYEQALEAGECEALENPPQPVGMVIFDDELSAKQIRNIEQELKVKILDRTTLIYPKIDRERCVGCGRCELSCRDGGHQAITFDTATREPHIVGTKCVGCHLCRLVCPTGAIGLTKRIEKK